MGLDIYYSEERGQKRLITAAEGLWRLKKICKFPEQLLNNRHIGIQKLSSYLNFSWQNMNKNYQPKNLTPQDYL